MDLRTLDIESVRRPVICAQWHFILNKCPIDEQTQNLNLYLSFILIKPFKHAEQVTET